MNMKMHPFFIALFFIFSAGAYSQTKISGKVVDPSIGEALIGASVVVEGTTVGTTTDIDGKFTFS